MATVKEGPMKRLMLLLAATVMTAQASAGAWPYNEQADAGGDIRHAITAAQADHKQVLLVFGANWCPDCRALDKAMHGSSERLITASFEVVKIDVGNFDKNLYLASRYGNPIAKGIPALVVINAENQVLYSTQNGELANAGKMTEQSIYDFLKQKIANRS
jgi:protein disulfide-isomerase